MPQTLDLLPNRGGLAVTLPPRQLGKLSIVLQIITLVGLIVAGVGVWFIAQRVQSGMQGLAGAMSLIGPILMTLVGSAVALVPAALRRSSTTIRLADGQLSSRMALWPFAKTFSIPTAQVTGLKVHVGTMQTNNGPKQPLPNLCMLAAETQTSGKPFILALLYPQDVLQPIADQLARKLGTRYGPLPVEQVFGSGDATDPDAPFVNEVLPQPTNSTIRVERHNLGVAYHLPPRGIWKGSRGLFFFALFWNGFMLVFSTIIIGATLNGTPLKDDSGNTAPWYIVYPFLSVFWIVGLSMLAASIHMSRRQAVLDVTYGSTPQQSILFLIMKNPLWKGKQIEFAPGDITAVWVGESGMEVNDRPVMHLKLGLSDPAANVANKGKSPMGLFTERDDNDLRWLASCLREDLGVPDRPGKN
jgi:hypothetical protein